MKVYKPNRLLMKKYFLTIILTTFTFGVFSQDNVVDKVIAVIGKNIVKLSDIEREYSQIRIQGNVSGTSANMKCQIFESLLFNKLLLNQAELDSIDVSTDQVDQEIEKRLRYFIGQFGSKEKFEKFYKKTTAEFKSEMKPLITEQLMVQKMQSKISGDLKITPSEVINFFNKILPDSIPEINATYEIAQIVKKPPIPESEKIAIKDKLNVLRGRIVKGESFSALAALYSDDPGSAKKGGELGFYARGDLYPEFEAVAYNLAKDEISQIVETKAGYHIIQVIERKGDYINVRHILLRPKASVYDLSKAKNILDSVALLVRNNKMSFEDAVLKFSDDDSKSNGGHMLNPYTLSVKFEPDEIDQSVFFTVEKLEVGQISNAVVMKTEDDQEAYRLLYLKKRTPPHKANLKDDYDKIQSVALENKRNEIVTKWVSNKLKDTYIMIYGEFNDCNFTHNWKNR